MKVYDNFLGALGIAARNAGTSTGTQWHHDPSAEVIGVFSPADGSRIADIAYTTETEYEEVISRAQDAFLTWRSTPAPKRGEIVRQIGEKLRANKEPLGKLVSYEMGKIYQEGLGEVQEMIDICDFAVGLSRQLYGLTIASERSYHRMMEQWHPLGIVSIITAFNFPVAVWSWNALIAAVCGDVCIWKASEKVPLCAVAVQKLVGQVLKENGLPEGIFSLVTGDYRIGQRMAEDKRIPLVSATGSVRMGSQLGPTVASRLGRSLLELGGNNAVILTPSAEQDMALRALVFGAAGTAGQRCTSTRRLIIHESIYEEFVSRLVKVYSQLRIGNPLDPQVIIGPLIDKAAVEMFRRALAEVEREGGRIIYGGEVLEGEEYASGCYVRPCLAEARPDMAIVQEETFAPILYLIKYSTLEEAIAIQNGVVQGLSSSIFTQNMREAEVFLSADGSDCGIANVNIGTSGAEIGGAFGGEKATGGGREAGSDSWKAYMRRQTNTINYGTTLPLAQGIEFPI